MEYAIRIRTALKHAARCALGARAPALPLALLRATVDARRLHRAAPYTEVQALALHTHTRKERSELGSERSSDRPGTPIWGECQGAGSASSCRRRTSRLWVWREMPQLRKGHYTWRTCAHMVVSLFDVGHVSKRHLVFDHLLAFCGFWLVSSVSIRHVSPLAHVALWRGPRVVFDGWRTWYSPRASWFVPQRSSRSRHVAYTSHVSSDTWFAHSSARLAHVANVLHVAREPDTSHVSSDTWFAHSSTRAGSRGERAPRGFF